MPLSFSEAARRADSAMGTITVTVICPDCYQPVRCMVYGLDVTIPDCADMADTCYGNTRTDRITDDARAKAQGERDDYARHLRDGGM